MKTSRTRRRASASSMRVLLGCAAIGLVLGGCTYGQVEWGDDPDKMCDREDVDLGFKPQSP